MDTKTDIDIPYAPNNDDDDDDDNNNEEEDDEEDSDDYEIEITPRIAAKSSKKRRQRTYQ